MKRPPEIPAIFLCRTMVCTKGLVCPSNIATERWLDPRTNQMISVRYNENRQPYVVETMTDQGLRTFSFPYSNRRGWTTLGSRKKYESLVSSHDFNLRFLPDTSVPTAEPARPSADRRPMLNVGLMGRTQPRHQITL